MNAPQIATSALDFKRNKLFKKMNKGRDKPNEPYESAIVADFLCRHHKVSDPSKIQLYGHGAVPAWMLGNETTIAVEFRVQGSFNPDKPSNEQVVQVLLPEGKALYKTLQPETLFVHPRTRTPMECDLTKVGIFQVACRAYSNSMPIPLAVAQNWQHESMAELQGLAVTEDMIEAAGGVRGAFVALDPTVDGKEEPLKSFPLPSIQGGYHNAGFVKTIMYLNEANLRNGLVQIPRAVCQKAGLKVATGQIEMPEDLLMQQLKSLKLEGDAEKDASLELQNQYRKQFEDMFNEENSKPIESWFALPANHVLATAYTSEAYRLSKGHHVFRFTYKRKANSDPVLLYYLVPDVIMHQLIEEATEIWLGKVDVRDITTVGMKFQPLPTPKFPYPSSDVQGTCMLRTYYSYVAGPLLNKGTIDSLAPIRSPDFIKAEDYCREDVLRKRAIEEYERQLA